MTGAGSYFRLSFRRPHAGRRKDMQPVEGVLPPDVPHEPGAVAEHVERRLLELRREMDAVRTERRTPLRELLAVVARDKDERHELLEPFEDGRPPREVWGNQHFREAALAYAARRRAAVREAAES
ncbi:hypothetical protein GCM10023339_02980 [Alloalcanivorax gelatiniphagus]